MFHMLILSLSGFAFAQDAEPADAPSEEIADEGMAGEDIPETDAETSGMQEGAAVEAPAAPVMTAEMKALQTRLDELGTCDIKKKKKRAKCETEKGEVELKLAELQPALKDEASTRATPAADAAEGAEDGADMGAEELPAEDEGLELDVGDE